MEIKVIKKDGGTEEYSEAKIAKVAVAAGLEPDQANTLASGVTKWLSDNSFNNVSTFDIRNKVLEGLKAVDEYAANFYLWYEKTKDIHNETK